MFTCNVSMRNFLLLGEGITGDDLAGYRQLSSKAPFRPQNIWEHPYLHLVTPLGADPEL